MKSTAKVATVAAVSVIAGTSIGASASTSGEQILNKTEMMALAAAYQRHEQRSGAEDSSVISSTLGHSAWRIAQAQTESR